MSAKTHPAYDEELKRCEYTLGYVKRSLKGAKDKKEKIDEDINFSRKRLTSDNSQSYIDLMVNTRIRDSLELKLRNLMTATDKPYFARIDFKEGNNKNKEKIYIGKMSLMRDEDQEMIIVDWRAPIANLYYEGRLGDSHYICPEGIVEGKLTTKRQFSINKGILEQIYDIDITTNDEFLQGYLGANAENRLKEIVSTIQIEQNVIIRSDMWKPLIVQGVAGSGKTTIALHRIAYLIYTYEKSFEPENFMIIAPNKLFLNYISEVLPELGVERVKQTTFESFFTELMGKKFKIKDSFEKINLFVNDTKNSKINNMIKKSSEIKASIKFKKIIDDFIEYVEADFIPKEDFSIEDIPVIKYEEINDIFINQYKGWPFIKRIDEIKKYLSNRLKQKKENIVAEIHKACNIRVSKIKAILQDSQYRQAKIIEIMDKRDEKIKKLEMCCKSAIRDYIKKISKISPYDYYLSFISNKELFNDILKKNNVEEETRDFLREYTYNVLKSGFIEIEDTAPILYLKYCIYGMDEKIGVKHIVIDEAQDFSTFQFYVLKTIVKDSSFTILGDICQGIHSYRGVKDWQSVMEEAFDDRKSEYLTLEQSYRTTVEIMNEANRVIEKIKDENMVFGKPVVRHGEEVKYINKSSIKELSEEIGNKIEEFEKQGFKTMAIICKTDEECNEVYRYLKKINKNISIITGKESEYKSGVVVVPSYLAKGLEFDIVFIADASSAKYTQESLDAKLLYVSMTRALHKLYIYYCNDITVLLT